MKEDKTAFGLIGKSKCTGCFGCMNACKADAIEMKLSEEGFFLPKIDNEKCTSCGLCAEHCPVIVDKNVHSKKYEEDDIKIYAANSTDDEIRFESSSGGVFTELCRRIIKGGGAVYGAAWDGELGVKHVCAEDETVIRRLRSSKYVQSNIKSAYKDVLHKLKEGRRVLFSGTPCQVAALKTFTDDESLVTVDVLCHGIPSRTVYDEYLKYIGQDSEIKSYTFRDKGLGWSKYRVEAEKEDGTIYRCITKEDPFFHGFICDLYINEPCYNCRFANIPRVGDITLGDYWKAPERFMDERGVSLVFANDKKGYDLLRAAEASGNIRLNISCMEDALPGNPRINNGVLRKRKYREEILKLVKDKGFCYINEKYIKNTVRYLYDEE